MLSIVLLHYLVALVLKAVRVTRVPVDKRYDVTLPNATRTTEKDSIRVDGLTSLHGNNGILTPSSVKGDYMLLFAVQSSLVHGIHPVEEAVD